MINIIKKNIIFILPIILIIYFSLNLLGGNRGLFSYLDKKDQFENLLEKKLFLTNEISKVKKINSLIDENLDEDYLEILIRDKFVVGKKGENTYIIKNE
jgi:cell division protein DivIC